MKQERKQIYDKIFLAVSSIGALFVLVELVMQLFGKSLCFTGGCKVVAQTARYGEISILLIGLLLFISLAFFTALSLVRARPAFERLINFILIIALACEGFFMGSLAFRFNSFCILCVIVFSLLVILGILRLLSRHHEVLAGFGACAAIFSLLYLVLPSGVTINAPEHERLVLFYSADCKYCSEVMAELERNNIIAKHVKVGAYAGLLRSIGIEGVPTLLVNEPTQKVFITGEEAIRRYILVCSEAKSSVGISTKKKKSGKASNQSTAPGTGLNLYFFTQQSIITGTGNTTPGAGVCKEEEICK